jgi:hypothetical protein
MSLDEVPQEKYQILPETLHDRALQYSLNNLDLELAGQSTDDLEFINGKLLSLPLLYYLHIERHENQPDDFNIHYLRGWRYGEMIIALAEKDRCPRYKAWQHLMQTPFHDQKAKNRIKAGPASCSKFELVDLTTPEPRRDQGSSNISSPPIIDLVTPEPALVVDGETFSVTRLTAAQWAISVVLGVLRIPFGFVMRLISDEFLDRRVLLASE